MNELVEKVDLKIKDEIEKVDKLEEFYSLKILEAFKKFKVSESDFHGTTGYGYNDFGRDKIELIFADVLGCEKALVRGQFISGTHALTVTLFGLLRPGDTLLSICGKPYDTLDEVIGIRENASSLKSFGINYQEIDLVNNDFDYSKIKEYLENNKGIQQERVLELRRFGKFLNLLKR